MKFNERDVTDPHLLALSEFKNSPRIIQMIIDKYSSHVSFIVVLIKQRSMGKEDQVDKTEENKEALKMKDERKDVRKAGFSKKETAVVTSLSVRSINNLLNKGMLKKINYGIQVIITAKSLERFINAGAVPSIACHGCNRYERLPVLP